MPSTAIFDLRRSGDPLAGYQLGKKAIEEDPSDQWVQRAFAYCALDLANAASQRAEYDTAQRLIAEVNSLTSILSDGILLRSIKRAESQANPNMKIFNQAVQASRSGNRQQALELYRLATAEMPDDQDVAAGLGWELYHQLNILVSSKEVDVHAIRKLLAEYIKLKNDRPSTLHSSILRVAYKISDQDNFNYVAFVKLWDLKNLNEGDYKEYTAENGKSYPSLAEKTIQKSAKRVERQESSLGLVSYILPFLDEAIERFGDNNWLVYYKAKLLHKIGDQEEALSFTTKFVRSKITDFWSWGLLADVVSDNGDLESALSCYCKSLLCRTDEDFLGKIRLKLARILIEKGLLENAKYEFEMVSANYNKNGWKIQESLSAHLNSDWYASTKAVKSNKNFYRENETKADELAFGDKPWLKGVLGDVFETNQSPPKKRRKIYVTMNDLKIPLEVSVSEKKYDFSSMGSNETLLIKGDLDSNNRFVVYLIKPSKILKHSDVFSEIIGVVGSVKKARGVFEFMVDREVKGQLNLADYSFEVLEGSAIALNLFQYYTRDSEIKYKAISCLHTDAQPNPELISSFDEIIENVYNSMAFTESGIFIDRNLVEKYKIQEGCRVQGQSILNFNRTRNIWGRKAIGILKIIRNYSSEKSYDLDDQFFENLAAPFLEDLN